MGQMSRRIAYVSSRFPMRSPFRPYQAGELS